mmetsp:Transcript_18868/g.52633  ORF Transcript_18868/g.52633 Transcript_18868/m.52633 type:complete len:109 (-) Transcript_18868:872-1198(-)
MPRRMAACIRRVGIQLRSKEGRGHPLGTTSAPAQHSCRRDPLGIPALFANIRSILTRDGSAHKQLQAKEAVRVATTRQSILEAAAQLPPRLDTMRGGGPLTQQTLVTG